MKCQHIFRKQKSEGGVLTVLKHNLSAFGEGLHDRWACWPAELLSEASDTLETQNDMVKDP